MDKENQLFYVDPFPDNKTPVVLLHGLGSDSSSWIYQINILGKEGFRPIAVDIPGFGRSSFPFRRWSIRKAALIICNQLIDNLKEPIVLIGLSMGGTIAQQITHVRYSKISKLILVSTFSRLRPTTKGNLSYLTKRVAKIIKGDIRSQAGVVAERIFPEPEQIELRHYLFEQIQKANPRIYRQAMLALGTFNSSRWLRKCDLPVLVVTGSNDSTVTIENQARLSRILKKSKFEIINGAGHALTIDHSDQFNKEMLDFLHTKDI